MSWKRDIKNVRGKDRKRYLEFIFWRCGSWHTYVFTNVVTSHHQVSQNFSIKRVLVLEGSSSAEDLMAIDKCWEIKRIKLFLEFVCWKCVISF